MKSIRDFVEGKIVRECTLPLTGKAVVKTIVTDLAYFEVTPEGLLLTELAPDTTVEQVRALTAAPFRVAPELRKMV